MVINIIPNQGFEKRLTDAGVRYEDGEDKGASRAIKTAVDIIILEFRSGEMCKVVEPIMPLNPHLNFMSDWTPGCKVERLLIEKRRAE